MAFVSQLSILFPNAKVSETSKDLEVSTKKSSPFLYFFIFSPSFETGTKSPLNLDEEIILELSLG